MIEWLCKRFIIGENVIISDAAKKLRNNDYNNSNYIYFEKRLFNHLRDWMLWSAWLKLFLSTDEKDFF